MAVPWPSQAYLKSTLPRSLWACNEAPTGDGLGHAHLCAIGVQACPDLLLLPLLPASLEGTLRCYAGGCATRLANHVAYTAMRSEEANGSFEEQCSVFSKIVSNTSGTLFGVSKE